MRFRIMDFDTFGDQYLSILSAVRKHGVESSPRGQATSEVIGATIYIANPTHDILPTGWNRNVSPGIAIAEAAQLISGTSYPDLMVEKFPNFKSFTDGGVWFHGAYGPRIKRQIPKMLDNLTLDRDSRQAVITIWDPAYDGYGDVKDSPCTLNFQFLIRNDHLHMVVNMRSNDVWWGLPYDVFQFTALQFEIASALDLSMGSYTHNAGSLHIYQRDYEAMDSMSLTRSKDAPKYSWPTMNVPNSIWHGTTARARRILNNNPANILEEKTVAELLHGK